MAKSTRFLNYLAFLILFITSFVFIFIENSKILGYILAFITNTFFIFFIFGEIGENLDDYTYFIPTISILSLLFSAILHFISLLFILILFYKLYINYTVKNKVPLVILEPYKTKLYNFNILMISVFSACAILTFIINFRWLQIDINFYEILKHINIFLFYKNITLFIAFILAAFSLGVSLYQIITISEFSQLSRNQINPAENKNKVESDAINSGYKPSFIDSIKNKLGFFYFKFF